MILLFQQKSKFGSFFESKQIFDLNFPPPTSSREKVSLCLSEKVSEKSYEIFEVAQMQMKTNKRRRRRPTWAPAAWRPDKIFTAGRHFLSRHNTRNSINFNELLEIELYMEKCSPKQQDPVSTMQKPGLTNFFSLLVWSGLQKGITCRCDHYVALKNHFSVYFSERMLVKKL